MWELQIDGGPAWSSMSGGLAFAPGGSQGARPVLLVADDGKDAVHVVDVVGRVHLGYLADPGSIAGPRGVAVSAAAHLVAVSSRGRMVPYGHVSLYRGRAGGCEWDLVRVIGRGLLALSRPLLSRPSGLRFTGDGAMLAVAASVGAAMRVMAIIIARFMAATPA